MWWSWKNWFWKVSTLGGCGGRCGCLERTDFEQFLLWDSVVVLKEVILNSFYFGRVWWSWKNWFWTVSTLEGCGGRCGGLERTDFEQFLLWDRCGSLERTDCEQFLLWKGVEVGVVVLKELILNSFYFGRVWWSWKNWFWTVCTLGQCGGLERTDFEQFLLCEGVVVSKLHMGDAQGSIGDIQGGVWTYGGVGGIRDIRGCPNALGHLNIWGCQDAPKHMGVPGQCLERSDFEHFYFGRVWQVACGGLWKNWFWTVSTLEGCWGRCQDGLERSAFWTGSKLMGGCGGLERYPILNSFYFGRVSSQCLERTDFKHFLLWKGVEVGVVVLKELILNSFYSGTVWWSWKNWFWTVSTFGGCGGLERTDFQQFLLWKGVEVGVVVLKELILNSFYFGTVWWSWKNWFWTVSTLGGCGGLERSDFEQFLLWEGVVVLKELILNSFYFWKRVVVLKELILNSFNVGRVWWSLKNSFWTVSILGRYGGLKRTDFEQFLLCEGVVVLK